MPLNRSHCLSTLLNFGVEAKKYHKWIDNIEDKNRSYHEAYKKVKYRFRHNFENIPDFAIKLYGIDLARSIVDDHIGLDELAQLYGTEYARIQIMNLMAGDDGKVICYFCGMRIKHVNRTKWKGKCLFIHHKNGNHSDNRRENIVPSHNSCHTKYHNSIRVWSEESKEKMSISKSKGVSLEIVYNVIKVNGPIGTTEIKKILKIHSWTIKHRLKKLQQQNRIFRYKNFIGRKSIVWKISDID